jgi:hypothetical protein
MRCFLMGALAALALAGCAEPPAPANTGPESAVTPAATVVALAVTDGWTRATPTGATAAGGYLTINNPLAQPDRLISVASARSPRVELHDMSSVNGVMQMRQVDGIDIPAAGSVSLAPGGLHIMFMDLSAGFAVGETVPVELTFAQAGVVNVTLEVRPTDAAAAPAPAAEAPAAAAAGEAPNQ